MTDPEDVLTRPAPPPDLTVSYGPHRDQVADVRLPPPGAAPGPPVVFVHGGFWRARYDRAHAGPLASDLAARGHVVVCPEYRRIGEPGGAWPAAGDDVLAALAAVPAMVAATATAAGRDKLDADRPVLMGHSAGGHLVLFAGRRVGPAGTRGVVALAPVADLAEAYRLRLGGGAVAQLLGGGPGDVPDKYAQADPAANLPLGVPAVVVHGDRDEIVPVALGVDFVAAARAAGDQARLVRLPAAEHFAVIDPRSPEWVHVVAAIDTLT